MRTVFLYFWYRLEKHWTKCTISIFDKLPHQKENFETLKILRETNKATAALAELKGIANTIPNQSMLVIAI